MESVRIGKENFLPLLVLGLLAGLISAIGLVGCFIGVIVTAPIGACIVTVAYREMTGAAAPAPAATPPPTTV